MTTYSKYTVDPFSRGKWASDSGPEWDAGRTPCAICGKGVKDPWPYRSIVINGGSNWGDENSPDEDGGHMGEWPVGSDCHRRFKINE